ncbi:hypothetical protein E4U57_003156 [Claviceps arundinis]|uniref:VWFA domain-containing protein n=1 Tax=Claviceps arundinis TaxID=1623583 RepID=A0ABQ7PJT9_9HYPO|nr:hypothetical protein E4U57_003156 [Claviceps arundinis]
MRIPLRQAQPVSDDAAPPVSAVVQLHPVPVKKALLVKVVTPNAPVCHVDHVPCDIVLVLDVSTSMRDDAPVPGDSEPTGLSVMDLIKHAALTILQTLTPGDRLGIVVFGTRSTVIQSLLYMNEGNKKTARAKIKGLRSSGSTNLWHGIQNGIRVFDESLDNGNVRAMMVLTDGMPNHGCPQQGFIPKLKAMQPLPATLDTFGFGYGVRSGLLKSLAEFGHGNYAFIPDAGMIGTVFVHAVANLQATFATEAFLSLTYSPSIQVTEVGETTAVKQRPQRTVLEKETRMALHVSLGNLQFGQTRDLFLRFKQALFETRSVAVGGAAEANSTMTATLSYRKSKLGPIGSKCIPEAPIVVSTQAYLLQVSKSLSTAELAYHESRAEICRFLSSLFPLGPDGEHHADLTTCESYKRTLAELVARIPAQHFHDARNISLMQDLNGPLPHGQISVAINNTAHLYKWGIHYLPSYMNAHSRQICNSFKDPGPLQYGAESPLFISCRDSLNDAFDRLPPPGDDQPFLKDSSSSSSTSFSPSSAHSHSSSTAPHEHRPPPPPLAMSMSRYRNPAGVCFAENTPVELASGSTLPIRLLRWGTKVRTPAGARQVAMVLRMAVQDETLCCVVYGVSGHCSLLVTPWHPISLDGGATWMFPGRLVGDDMYVVEYTGWVYSVMLQPDGNAASHAIRVGGSGSDGVWGVTLGHGVVRGRDVRAHCFLGDYGAVGRSLAGLGEDKFGVVEGRGVRDGRGLVCGFGVVEGDCENM